YYNILSLYADYRLPKYRLHYDRIGQEGAGNPWEREGEGPEAFFPPPVNIRVGGLQPEYYSNLYYEVGLNYARAFGKHSVTGLALWNRQQRNEEVDFPYYNEAFVARGTYDFGNKYLAEINLGYTGSERFAPTNRYGFFPSGAVGWVISNESFFKEAVPWVNNLKIRYSEGLVGSDYADNRWLYISNFTKTGAAITEDLGANLHAQWEQARKRDLGLEVALFDNMFTITVDVYNEYREKMLLEPRS